MPAQIMSETAGQLVSPTGHYGVGWDTALCSRGLLWLWFSGSREFIDCTDLLSGWTDAVENSGDVNVSHQWIRKAILADSAARSSGV